MEFFNMGMITLCTSLIYFNPITSKLLQFTGTSIEQYTSFTPEWYMDTGRELCLFLFTSIFFTNSYEICEYLFVYSKRVYDCGGFRLSIKKDVDDEDDDDVHTRKKVQADLVHLYMGVPFNGAKAFSRMMSTIFVILLFSSGMPVLYFIGMIWFTVSYLAYKLLILKFYKTTVTMNSIIP